MTESLWNDRYASGNSAWDSGNPEPVLVERITSGRIAPGKALEVGSGTGTNALWLAEHGFDVFGIDLSPVAVEKARAKAQKAALPCRFAVLDILGEEALGGPYDFVFDRGCFHVFDEPKDRARFASRIARVLAVGGHWLTLCGSTEGPARELGPPRRSARELASAIEPELEIIELHEEVFSDIAARPRAWSCLSRRRAMPAQPSTPRLG